MINTGYVKIGETAKRLMADVLDNSRISCGKYVSEFESIYAEKHGVKHAITVGSGTEADIIALLALKEYYNIPDNSNVIVPATCFISVANSVKYAGLNPIFVDTDPFNMDLDQVRWILASCDIKAIIGVHFGGLPLDIAKLKEIAGDIPIIEDCACAHGTIANGKIAGSNTIVSTWSLYVAHIVTAGGGGVIGTSDDKLAEIIKSIRAYGRSCTCSPCLTNTKSVQCQKRFKNGQDIRFLYKRMGLNSRMTEMEAVIGIDQMEIYSAIIMQRLLNFHALNTLLIGISDRFVTFPQKPSENSRISPIFFPIVIINGDRNTIVEYLELKGIETRNLYASIPTQQPAYKWHDQFTELFLNAEKLGNNGFYVGIHQGLTAGDIKYLAEHITIALERWAE